MQPRNIEVFDGLRITTDHFDHLQGSIHSALEDFRGILGLGRVHRGFGVTAVDAHSIQVDPGLAFDSTRRRVVSDEPVKLEVPAAIATAPQFVCVSYEQGADGDIEGRATRIWDSARVDIRAASPALTDDAVVIAVLEAAESGEGFTIRMGGAPAPVENGDEEPLTEEPASEPPAAEAAPEPAAAPFAIRSGVFTLPEAAIDRVVFARLTAAIRDAAAAGAPVTFVERLASQEVLAGVVIASISIDAAARLTSKTPPDDAGVSSVAWRIESAGHGQARVADDGTLAQFGAATSYASWPSGASYACASFAPNAVLTLRYDTASSGEDAARAEWLAGLRLTLRCAPRNGDGFAVDTSLEWNGQGSETIAAWLEAWAGSLHWMAEGGWSTIGTTRTVSVTPGG